MEEAASAIAAVGMRVPMEDRLETWLDCFLDGAPRWGLVDYWRGDGTSYKRQGIIAAVNVNLWNLLTEHSGQLVRLREAIDLTQLVLLVQPSAFLSVLRKRRQFDRSLKPDYTEELDAISRGVPVALELRFEVGGTSIPRLKDRFNDETIKPFDWTLSTDESFLEVRQELMERVKSDQPKLLQLIHKTARAVVVVKQWYSDDASEETSVEFFEDLRLFADDLSKYQRERLSATRADTMKTRHTHFEVAKINLELGRGFITPRVVAAATKFVDAGFPINCCLLKLDLRLIECDEDTLRTFLQAMMSGDTKPRVETLAKSLEEVMQEEISGADDEGEDLRERIRMLLRAVASVSDRACEVELGGLLKLCDSSRNRESVWRGLFNDILSQDAKVHTVAFADSVILRIDDATAIEQCAAEWRAAHPNVKIHVKQLRLQLTQPIAVALNALLAAFDDINEVSIMHSTYEWPLSREIVHNLLAFPGLRKLQITNATVSTLDLFDPTAPDDRFPVKPVLEELVLTEIVLHDVPSLRRFFEKLNPVLSTSPLTTSLQKLHVTQRNSSSLNPVNFYDSSMLATLTNTLEANSVLQEVMVTDVGDKSMLDQWVRFFTYGCRYLPVPRGLATDLDKVCKAAFLSTISPDASELSDARSRLDPSLVRLVFDFSAPVVSRTVCKDVVKTV